MYIPTEKEIQSMMRDGYTREQAGKELRRRSKIKVTRRY